MVNFTRVLFRRNPLNVQPDTYWKRRQLLKMSAHFYARQRNCKSVAYRAVMKSLTAMTQATKAGTLEFKRLWEKRIGAGSQELGYMPQGTPTILEGLAQQQILIDRHMLSELSIWEPRTFKAINKVAAVKAHDIRLPNLGPRPTDVDLKLGKKI